MQNINNIQDFKQSKYYFLITLFFLICVLFNIANAQDTLPRPKWWFNSTISLPELGGGYFSDGTKAFNMGYDYNNVISRTKNIYAQIGVEVSMYHEELFTGADKELNSINFCAGKVFLNHKHFFACGFIGPSYGSYSYYDNHSVTTYFFNALGISVNTQYNICFRNSRKEMGAGIGIELSANINRNMSVFAFRIITPIIKYKHK